MGDHSSVLVMTTLTHKMGMVPASEMSALLVLITVVLTPTVPIPLLALLALANKDSSATRMAPRVTIAHQTLTSRTCQVFHLTCSTSSPVTSSALTRASVSSRSVPRLPTLSRVLLVKPIQRARANNV